MSMVWGDALSIFFIFFRSKKGWGGVLKNRSLEERFFQPA